MLAMFYLVVIVIFITVLLRVAEPLHAEDDLMAAEVTVPVLAAPDTGAAVRRTKWLLGRIGIYALLVFWAFVSLFPIYWTITTSMKVAKDVQLGRLIPWVDFQPDWLGWRSLGLSPDTIGAGLDGARRVRRPLPQLGLHRLRRLGARGADRRARRLWPVPLPVQVPLDAQPGHLASSSSRQLILPPVVLALPFLVLYRELALLDTTIGLILLYTLTVLPIVIWIMKDQFDTIPIELDEAALVDGLGPWGTFFRIILPIALPGMVAAFILSLILCWNEYFFAALLTGSEAKTLPVMVASQTGSQGINWWSMAALSTAAIAPLVIVGILLERYIIKGLTAGSVKG